MAPAAELASGATALHYKQGHLTLRLPPPGHQSRTPRRQMRLPAGLPGYYISMRIIRSDGRALPPAPRGRTIYLRGSHGEDLVALTLTSGYDPKRGRLRYGVIIKNLRVRNYRSKRAGLSALVTVAYRS